MSRALGFLCPVLVRLRSARRCHFRDLLERRQDDRLRSAPLAGALLSRTVPVAMTATGGSFTKVVFKLGTEYLLTDSRTPFGLNFDTTQFADGRHTLSAYTINTSSVTGTPTARSISP